MFINDQSKVIKGETMTTEPQRTAHQIAEYALELRAIELRPDNPFEWASGYRMPIYNDNRLFLFQPEKRALIERSFVGMIREEEIEFDVVAGTATAGIPWASFLAKAYSKPLIYVRPKKKGHGLQNRIEGLRKDQDLEGLQVLVIEDLISTGGSSASAVQAVRDRKGIANNLISVFSYGLSMATEHFEKLNPPCTVNSLLTYPVLWEVAKEAKYITDADIEMLDEWRAAPFDWGGKQRIPTGN